MENETTNIMNEEIMEETEVMDLQEETYELSEEINEGGNGGMTVLKVVGVLGLGAAIAYGIKKREDIKEWRNNRLAKKLRKQGYIVNEPEFFDEDELFDDDFEVDCDDDGSGNIIEIEEGEK